MYTFFLNVIMTSREKELWHNKVANPTNQQQQAQQNYLEAVKAETLFEQYDVSKKAM